MISNKDLRVEGSNLIINGEKHPLDPAVIALAKRANIVQGKLSALDTKLDAIEALEKSASGNPISITGAAAAYAMSNIMTIEPIQSGSGDPSPTNIRPISGISEAVATRCGFNIWDEVCELGKYATDTGEPESSNNTIRCKSAIKVNSGLQIYFKFPAVNYKRMAIYFYDENDNFLSPRQILSSNQIITVPANAEFLRFYMTDEYGATYNNDICINVSDTNKNGHYEPYTAANATITFGQTVYGGSVNFKTGEVTVTHGFVEYDGSVDEDWDTISTQAGNTYRMKISPPSDIKLPPDNSTPVSAISNQYLVLAANSVFTQNTGLSVQSNGGYLAVYDVNYNQSDSVSAWKAHLASEPLTVCYELATPTTLTLTPAELELLKGANTISGNGVTINIDYIGR